MSRFTNLFLALASGLLLWAAWPVSHLTFLVFVAWVPLLWLENKVSSRRKFFGLTYITMLTWNVAATWWIWNASAPGAVGAFLANSLLMCFPWLGFKIAKKWLGEKIGYASLVVFWMCFEYIHLQDWGLSWPWLTLGNVFATHPEWIQWYEYTGTSGGTLWVMVVNVLLFLHVKNNFTREGNKSYKNVVIGISLMIVPILLSIVTPSSTESKPAEGNIVVVQPNIDPYEKVSSGSLEAQLEKLISTSEKEMDDKTALVIWPETALYTYYGINEERIKDEKFLIPLWDFLKRHPHASLFTGIESVRLNDSKKNATAIGRSRVGMFMDAFNGSVLMDSTNAISFYHKSKLVPGVETLPWFLRFIDSWFEKFGGTTAGYAKQDERTVLTDAKHGYKIAPAICYESIYGEFMSQYVRNGANLIAIITNDGWWKNTPGHKQHLYYARLRAIETRRWVARSANTGISAFVDPYGNIFKPQGYNTTAAIKLSVPLNESKTFYVRYGDVLSKVAVAASLLLLIANIVLWLKKKFK